MNLNALNPEQRRAVTATEGPVLIFAGAGSGKTRTLTYRVAHLIESGVAPGSILALTFTNKAAREMRERVTALVGTEAEQVWVSTFHAMCARILRRDIDKLGYSRSFTIYDDDDQNVVVKEALRHLNLDEKTLQPRVVRAIISDAKNRLQNADEWFQASDKDYRAQTIHSVFTEYEKRLQHANALDFDDLLLKTLQLFADHPPVLDSYRRRFQYIHVDEYQDTNLAQYQLVRLLSGANRNLCVVGDDDQSIYGWRGADIQIILGFEKDYPDAAVIKLEQNYRSTANILDAANQVIAHNEGRKEKTLWTDHPEGDKIQVFRAGDEREEAAWVCDRMQKLRIGGERYDSMAVLYRMNSQSRVLEEMLIRAGIPYRVFGGLRFYDRKEVRDVIAYLRVIANPQDDVSLRRIINQPKRSIGDATVQELAAHAQRSDMPLYSALFDLPDALSARPRKCVSDFAELMSELALEKDTFPLAEFVDRLIQKTGLQAQYEKEDSDEARSRLENIRELMAAVVEFAEANENATLDAFLEQVSLVSDLDQAAQNASYVTLMTMHSAKGLEFDDVFVVGMEENIFPGARSIQDEKRMEEERRLCYVAITRARRRLFLSHASQRMLYNQICVNPPSRFLAEIPPRLTDTALSQKRDRSFPQMAGEPDAYERRRTPHERAPHGPLGVPSVNVPQGGRRVVAAGASAMGIPGVQKGFTPSLARSVTPAPRYQTGDRVMHKKFGEGSVVAVTGSGRDSRVRIAFAAYGEKEFELDIAPIVKLNEDVIQS